MYVISSFTMNNNRTDVEDVSRQTLLQLHSALGGRFGIQSQSGTLSHNRMRLTPVKRLNV